MSRPARVLIPIMIAAALGGSLVSAHYYRLGLTLSHYDARGHLVVARRVFDSLAPGWQQFGAVGLPLLHRLNLLPVQIDRLYRTGLSATSISVVSFAIASGPSPGSLSRSRMPGPRLLLVAWFPP
jgi:hypothetical protein